MTNNTRTLIHKLKKHQDEIPYFMISREVVQSIDNPLALAIWVYLQSKADDWKVIEADIMKQFAVGRTTYLKAMKCLREAQLYSVERYKNEENQFVGSVFHVYEKPTSTDFHTYGNPHVWESTRMETDTYIKEEEITTEEESITEEESWLLFWENYPKKVAKIPAEKAFKRLSIDKQILACEDNAAQRYSGRRKGVIPNPATYLNEERWNDEQDEVAITSHRQINSMVKNQKVLELNNEQLKIMQIRRRANAH